MRFICKKVKQNIIKKKGLVDFNCLYNKINQFTISHFNYLLLITLIVLKYLFEKIFESSKKV